MLGVGIVVSVSCRSAVQAQGTAVFAWFAFVLLYDLILIGSLAVAYGDPGRWSFGAGAMLASAIWFPLIGFGAARLGRFLTRPAAWRVVDAVIAVQLVVLAVALARPTAL